MTEQNALLLLRKQDPEALGYFIDRYTNYVGAVVWAVLGGRMSLQDAEEVTADVFVTLWKNPEKPRPGKVKAWLGAVARNKAVNKFRELGQDLPLEEDVLFAAEEDLDLLMSRKERAEALRRALDDMGEPDREIFLRHYYYGQSGPRIAELMGLSSAAVRQRLKRGRDKLRAMFEKGGVVCGNSDL